jgi:hypothetical protein
VPGTGSAKSCQVPDRARYLIGCTRFRSLENLISVRVIDFSWIPFISYVFIMIYSALHGHDPASIFNRFHKVYGVSLLFVQFGWMEERDGSFT